MAEVFLEWQSLKPPKSDQEFIKFVTCIENGVSCLRSLGHDKEAEFSFMSVTLEKKLDDRMKKEFSLEYTSDQDQNKERMKSLLHYLKKQKAAAHLRFCIYLGSKAAVEVVEAVATDKKVLNKVMLNCRKVASEAEVVIKAEDVVVLSEEKVPRAV